MISTLHTGAHIGADNNTDEVADGDLLELPEGTQEVNEPQINELNGTNDEPEKKRKKITAKEKIIQEIKSGREERNAILKDLLSAQKTSSAPVYFPEHSIDIFFKSMSEVVKTLPRHLQAETRLKVCQLVTEMEMKAFAEDAQDSVPSNHFMPMRHVNSTMATQTVATSDSSIDNTDHKVALLETANKQSAPTQPSYAAETTKSFIGTAMDNFQQITPTLRISTMSSDVNSNNSDISHVDGKRFFKLI